jgi:hypothetical protein
MAGWGNNTFGFLKWGTFGDEYVNVTNPNDSVWGQDSYGSSFWSGGGNLNADIGPVSITSEVNAGWGSDTWGYETWGISGLTVDLTGIELSLSLDSVTTKSDVDNLTVTGEEATVVAGTGTEAGTTVDADVTGIPLTATLQYQEAIVDPTGIELVTNDGTATLDANTIVEVSANSAATWNGNFAWGYGVWGNQQVTTLAMSMQEGDSDPAPDVSLTGNAAAMFLGQETITADANLTLSGIGITMSLGTATLDANTIASITGQLMTMQEGDEGITANANVTLIGNTLTMATGTVYNLIWNDVNTGTAPIVPPGWQEVDTAA